MALDSRRSRTRWLISLKIGTPKRPRPRCSWTGSMSCIGHRNSMLWRNGHDQSPVMAMSASSVPLHHAISMGLVRCGRFLEPESRRCTERGGPTESTELIDYRRRRFDDARALKITGPRPLSSLGSFVSTTRAHHRRLLRRCLGKLPHIERAFRWME